MIYATIPSKYLLDELTEILKDLKMLYISLAKLSDIRDVFSEELLECKNDGRAYEIGQWINSLSTQIKGVKHNANTITQMICEEEHITLEECTNIMVNLIVEETLKDGQDLLEMPNEIAIVLMNKISKKYPKYTIHQSHNVADGSCTDY
jgi:hypothetical protein